MSLLSVKKLSKNIKNRNIIKDINFSINSAEIVGLLGPNGGGTFRDMRSANVDANTPRAELGSGIGLQIRTFRSAEKYCYFTKNRQDCKTVDC